MTQYRQIVVRLAVYAVPAGLFFLTGWLVARRTTGDPMHDVGIALLGFAFIIAGALVLAIPLARLVGEPAGSLFYPSARFEGPQPMYGIPESKRKSGFPEEAMAGYERLAEQYPQEVKPYIAMMEIAIVDLGNVERGTRIYEKGMSVITNPDDQAALSRFYIAHCSRVAGPPEWLKQQREKVISPKQANAP